MQPTQPIATHPKAQPRPEVILALGACLLALPSVPSTRAGEPGAVASGDPAAAVTPGRVEASDAELAKDLQNPVADVITLPLENRVDVGPGSDWRYTMTAQPVLPFEVTSDWMVVSRTLLSVIAAPLPAGTPDFDDPSASPIGTGPRVGGLGDLTQSFFFAPKKSDGSLIWALGPVLRMPTATRSSFGQGRWGAGPTGVVLRQQGAWTYGALANQIWSFAGWGPENVNTTYLQPFLAYTTESLMTFGAGSEAVYDWNSHEWVVPLDFTISQLFRIGQLPLQVGLGGRYYAERPANGPVWGVTLTVTFMFSK